jgi:hypothetical protein
VLFGLEMGVLLVLQVSQRTRQVQISVYTTISDCTTCLMDAVNFYLAFRLMIERERHTFAAMTHHAPTVTRISNHQLAAAMVDQHNIGCATDSIKHESLVRLIVTITIVTTPLTHLFRNDFHEG